MQISGEQLAVLTKKIEKLWPEPRRCPVCGSTGWSLLDRVMEIREFERGALSTGGKLIPLVSITCSTCGHTLLFNAITLGVVEAQHPASTQAAQGVVR